MSTSPTLALRQKLVAIAAAEVGVREIPKNSNSGPRVREYQDATDHGGTGWYWCAAFICWCVKKWGEDPAVLAALKMTSAEFERWRPKTASAYGFEDWAKKRGVLIIRESDHPGEAVLHTGDIMTLLPISHIALIDTDKGNTIYTLEGNTDAAGSREGGGVYSKIRPRSFARCIIRILP